MKRSVEFNRMTYAEQRRYHQRVPYKFVVPVSVITVLALGYLLAHPQKADASAPIHLNVTYSVQDLWVCREKHLVPVILRDDSLFCAEVNEKKAK